MTHLEVNGAQEGMRCKQHRRWTFRIEGNLVDARGLSEQVRRQLGVRPGPFSQALRWRAERGIGERPGHGGDEGDEGDEGGSGGAEGHGGDEGDEGATGATGAKGDTRPATSQ